MVGWEKKGCQSEPDLFSFGGSSKRCIILGDAHPTFHGRHGIRLYAIGNMGENGGKEKVRESGFIG